MFGTMQTIYVVGVVFSIWFELAQRGEDTETDLFRKPGESGFNVIVRVLVYGLLLLPILKGLYELTVLVARWLTTSAE